MDEAAIRAAVRGCMMILTFASFVCGVAWVGLFGVAVCAAVAWEIVAAVWRLWPWPL